MFGDVLFDFFAIAPAAHGVAVVGERCGVEQLVAKLFVELAVALRVGEEYQLGAAMLFDVWLYKFFHEFPAYALALVLWVDGDGTEVPCAIAYELMARFAGGGIHLQPVFYGLSGRSHVYAQPTVEHVLQIRRFLV